MFRRFLSALFLLPIVGLLGYTVLLNPRAKASPNELTVVTRTRGHEVLKAEILDGEVTFTLKNNHKQTITAFTISFGDTFSITEDFAYSEVHQGIAPGDTFEKRYQLSASDIGLELPTLYLQTVLLENGEDGYPRAAQRIKDERIGEKIQFLRTLRILEKQTKLPKDLRVLKGDVVAALNTEDSETLTALNELESNPLSRRNKLSDDVRTGLQVGRGKMLQRLEALEQFSSDRKDTAFTELKTRSSNILSKLND